MKNKEKFLALVSKEKSNTLEKNAERITNRKSIRKSQNRELSKIEAIIFAEWLNNNYIGSIDNLWYKDNKGFTTEELYQIFKSEK